MRAAAKAVLVCAMAVFATASPDMNPHDPRETFSRLAAKHLEHSETYNEALDQALADLVPPERTGAEQRRVLAETGRLPVDVPPPAEYTSAWTARLPEFVTDPTAGYSGGSCNDPHAVNDGASGACSYD